MKRLVRIITFLFIGYLYPKTLIGQIHDFDSLMLHSEEFNQITKSISDTLDLFNDDHVLRVTFVSDFKNLVKRKYKDEYQPAVFKLMFNDTVQVVREIKIKPRGNMRKGTCLIPPIKLNFPKKTAFIKQLEEFDKMKMVLDCKKGASYEQYLLSEYYAYKIQHIITDFSLRVRLLQVTYIDLGGRYNEILRYAFLIESIDQFTERKNTIRIETKNVSDLLTDRKTLTEAYLFQYLIGNTDWSIPGMHNIFLIKSKDPSIPKPYVVPYDFDYAGIVNTNYAIPDEQLGTESVRERVYRGVCLNKSDLFKAAALFIEKKQSIYDIYENDQLLTKNTKRDAIKYLDEFYTVMENENRFRRNILESCR